jgi:hypothetical protein
MTPLPIDDAALAAFCRRWKIAKLELFGSALGDDFGPQSDFDLLYTYEPGAGWSLLDTAAIQRELSDLLGRHVDLVSRKAIEGSRNWIRRREILGSAQPVYAGR